MVDDITSCMMTSFFWFKVVLIFLNIIQNSEVIILVITLDYKKYDWDSPSYILYTIGWLIVILNNILKSASIVKQNCLLIITRETTWNLCRC